jgi:hypothetical protein
VARKTQASEPGSSQEDPLVIEDWTDARKHIIRKCNFDIDNSAKLYGEEKDRVKILMKEYVIKDPIDFEKHNHELALLLDKAFVAKFDVKILHKFTAVREVNS